MGNPSYREDDYIARETFRATTGTTAFLHDDDIRAGRTEAGLHPKMDPKGVTRESRDSENHPESNAIIVDLDVTGSMRRIPRLVQQRLNQLMGMLLRKNYIAHPQILFAATGDATCDRAPLQVGQFESDITMEDDLGRLFLEGNGGNGLSESYALAAYFFATHTSIDCFEKRGKKGLCFFIGDEPSWPATRKQIDKIIGDTVQADITPQEAFALLQEKYDVYYLLPKGAAHGGSQEVLEFWRDLINPQNVIELENAESICEVITMLIGFREGTIDLDQGLNDLAEFGVTDKVRESVSTALATFTPNTSVSRASGTVPVATGNRNVKIL